MIAIDEFITDFSSIFPGAAHSMPWEITQQLPHLLQEAMLRLDSDFVINGTVAMHKTAAVEQNVVIKGPAIIGPNCFIGANAYLRGGVFMERDVKIGPGCEVKQSVIFSHTALAHFNYVGNSVIGHHVNFEAGSVVANHYNERQDKAISVIYRSKVLPTGVDKFGALVGDHSKIGANAVLSPGTLLDPGSVVRRLELIKQLDK